LRSFPMICRGQDLARDVSQLRQGEVAMVDYRSSISTWEDRDDF
jgi:hypothetical protein